MIVPAAGVDIDATLKASFRQTAAGAFKTEEDLDRFEETIADGRPDVVVETGSWQGGSARWFADRVDCVVSIDINGYADRTENITWIKGDSSSPRVLAQVRSMLDVDDRVMVVLDSCHKPSHVMAELRLWAPLVTVGCWLVVEDAVIWWMHEDWGWRGEFGHLVHEDWPGPGPALEHWHRHHPEYRRDWELEERTPVSMFVGGWMRREA